MLTLVANLGSTSFKCKLFDMSAHEAVLATGSVDRIGQGTGAWKVEASGKSHSGEAPFADHAGAIDLLLAKLIELGAIASIGEVSAVGFKAVHGGPISGSVRVDDEVLATMQRFADVAPAHNPPYIAAMKAFAAKLPGVPLVAAFETAFHQSIPEARTAYAIPYAWHKDLGIRRYGFHGASHRYIATRMAEISPSARRVISCHLGGSSSMCAIENGRSVATTMGLTPQSGLPQSGRVGDFEIFALLKLNAAGISTEEALKKLGKESGLLGLSGVSADMRDIQAQADQGNARAKLAIDVFVESIRHYLGAYMAVLKGVDAIAFTGGIGQNQKGIRAAVCANLGFAGIKLDLNKNLSARGSEETLISADDSKVAVWVLPTNEELIVARQTVETIAKK